MIRRARPTVSGTVFKYIDFYVRPDFGLGHVVLYDTYIDFKYFPHFVVRAGKFKPPVGLERLQSDDDTNFIERGFPTLLVPSRDIGYQISGDVVKRLVNYAVGVFNGVADNSLSDAGTSSHKDYAGRLVLTPFQSANQAETKNPLSGLGVGVAATSGAMDGVAVAGINIGPSHVLQLQLRSRVGRPSHGASRRKPTTMRGRSGCWPSSRERKRGSREAPFASRSRSVRGKCRPPTFHG